MHLYMYSFTSHPRFLTIFSSPVKPAGKISLACRAEKLKSGLPDRKLTHYLLHYTAPSTEPRGTLLSYAASYLGYAAPY